MEIIAGQNVFRSDKDLVILKFKNDAELLAFIKRLVQIETKSSGLRIVSLLDEDVVMNKAQQAVMDIIMSLDGISPTNYKSLLQDAAEKLETLINENKR